MSTRPDFSLIFLILYSSLILAAVVLLYQQLSLRLFVLCLATQLMMCYLPEKIGRYGISSTWVTHAVLFLPFYIFFTWQSILSRRLTRYSGFKTFCMAMCFTMTIQTLSYLTEFIEEVSRPEPSLVSFFCFPEPDYFYLLTYPAPGVVIGLVLFIFFFRKNLLRITALPGIS